MNISIEYYKNEISQVIVNKLSTIYNIKDKEDLLKYTILKFFGDKESLNYTEFSNIRDIHPSNTFFNFICKEIGLMGSSKSINFKGLFINKYGYYSSYISILEELEATCLDFLNTKRFYRELNDLYKELNSYAYEKSEPSLNMGIHKYYYHNFYLEKLNILFGVNPSIKKITMPEFNEDLVYIIPIEFVLNNIINKIESRFNYLYEVKVSEFELENFLYKNLNLLDDGLKPLCRQFRVSNGRLDILAKNKDYKHIIIELKVEEDTDIIFQCKHYYDEISRIKNSKNIKVIVIAPKYNSSIKKELKKLKNIIDIEIYTYNAYSKNLIDNKIIHINFCKIF